MKKVINGKVYNTETADLIKWTDNGYFPNDFNYRCEALYRTKKGNWFVYHEGGAMTDMAVPCGSNSWSGSSTIQAVTPEEAKKFLMENNAIDELEEYFPGSLEDA